MAKLETVWLVTDPEQDSELSDILCRCSLVTRGGDPYFFDVFRGIELLSKDGGPGWEGSRGTLYLDEGEARRDAVARLKRLGSGDE